MKSTSCTLARKRSRAAAERCQARFSSASPAPGSRRPPRRASFLGIDLEVGALAIKRLARVERSDDLGYAARGGQIRPPLGRGAVLLRSAAKASRARLAARRSCPARRIASRFSARTTAPPPSASTRAVARGQFGTTAALPIAKGRFAVVGKDLRRSICRPGLRSRTSASNQGQPSRSANSRATRALAGAAIADQDEVHAWPVATDRRWALSSIVAVRVAHPGS